MATLKVAGFFSGAGGLDTGFKNAGFALPWANEYDKKIVPTLQRNHPDTTIDPRDLFNVTQGDIPEVDGYIGGPPCQSWSLGGKGLGLQDRRGEVFLKYLELIRLNRPKFFLAENVKGMLARTRQEDFNRLLEEFETLGYNISYQLLNAADYGVPQDRWRVIFVGYRKDLNKTFVFPEKQQHKLTLQEAIHDLKSTSLPALEGDKPNPAPFILNHEHSTGGFSSQYMSRNRMREWGQQSFTIQASGRQAPLHPDSGGMVKVDADTFRFGNPERMRRLSVREVARIQSFPDDYEFLYDRLELGYKMVGNAVPVKLAETLAQQIFTDLTA